MENQAPQLKTRKPKLTKKQRVFVANYAETENGTKSALAAYDTKDPIVAKSIATENLTKPPIINAIEDKRKSLRQALIDKGIDEDKIAEKIDVLLNAEEKVFRNNVSTGEIEEIGTKTDFTAVDKGLKHATAIFGIVPEGNKTPSNVTYNFLFSKETQESIAIINKTIKEKLINVQPD